MLPKMVPLGPKMGSQLQPRSRGLVLPQARGSIHKALEGHKDRHQHITEAHHQAGSQGCSGHQLQPPTSHLPAAPLPRARAGNPHSFIPESIPASASLPKTATAASCEEHCNCLPASPTNPNIPQYLHLSSPT